MTTPKKTPTQRVKELEAENKQLKKLIMSMTDEHGTSLAIHGNEQYTLGYDEGHRDASASAKAGSYIARIFKG